MKYQKRGDVSTVDEAVCALSGLTIDELMRPEENPFIKGMDEAVAFYKEHDGMPLTVVGDYDVDGVMSSVIMSLGITAFTGRRPVIRIPHRKSEGYGYIPVGEINDGMVITIDNGIGAVESVRELKGKNIPVIVMDHHLGGKELPEADVIVDPEAVPGSGFTHYCGASLAFEFVKRLIPENAELLEKLEGLAAVATIADVVPLIGANRARVRRGMDLINAGKTTNGMLALLKKAGIAHVDEEQVAFYLGPMLNAPGRLYDDGAMKAFRLIASDDSFAHDDPELDRLAASVIDDNGKRKEMVAESAGKAERSVSGSERVIVWYDPDCDEGVIGIVAGRLAETYGRPAIVLTDSGTEGTVKGSGRSVPEVDLVRGLLDKADCLIGYGGHSQAAGLSLKKEDIPAFKGQMDKAASWFEPKAPELFYDLDITAGEVPAAAGRLAQLAPFGEGVPEPVFKISGFRYNRARRIGRGKDHVSFAADGFDAVGFGMAETFEDIGEPDTVDIVGTIGTNRYGGRITPQFRILEIAKGAPKEKKMSLEEFLDFM